MNPPKAILFDLDNTILAFDIAGDRTWEELSKKFALRLDGLEGAALLEAVQKTRDKYWGDPERDRLGRLNLPSARREIVSEAFSFLGIDAPQISNEMADEFTVAREKAVEPFPGAIETLKRLSASGILLGLITQGQAVSQRSKIERFGLAPLFGHILIEGEFGIGKPDRRVFLHTLEQLRVDPKDAWMVGDHLTNDVEGAQKVGMRSIWVDWRGNGLPESTSVRPDRIIQAISELMESG